MSITPLIPTAPTGLLLDQAAARLFHVSRDIYAPVLAAFAAHCLNQLRGRPTAQTLCLARDGISAFLAQRTLLRLAPEMFGGVRPDQVRLAYLSRQLMRQGRAFPQTRELAQGYLRSLGLRDARQVNLVDVGIHGSIQDHLQRWFPQTDLRGLYLLYRRRAQDTLADQKSGYLVGNPLGANHTTFLRRPAIHLLEDLWSGVYESVTSLRLVERAPSGRFVRPVLEQLGTRGAVLLVPQTIRALKQAALRGAVAGVTLAARQSITCLTSDDAAPECDIRRLADWIAASREPDSPDAWLWTTLIRPDHDRNEPSDC